MSLQHCFTKIQGTRNTRKCPISSSETGHIEFSATTKHEISSATEKANFKFSSVQSSWGSRHLKIFPPGTLGSCGGTFCHPINMASHDSLKGKRTRSRSPSRDKNAFIIVFDSKQDEKTRKSGAKKRKESSQLEFINSTSGQPVEGAREIIRTHVMSDYWRKKLSKNKQDQRPVLTEQDPSHINNALTQSARNSLLLCQPLGGPDPFSRLSIKMKPYMYTILERCKLYLYFLILLCTYGSNKTSPKLFMKYARKQHSMRVKHPSVPG